jgi:hypothetical protein
MKIVNSKKGVVLVEVLLATGILGLLLVPFLNFFVASIESSWFASKEVKAQTLAIENLEVLRSIRERNWPELVDGSYYPSATSGRWELVPSASGETIDSFTRKIEITPVYRDGADLIVDVSDPGARLDPSTKKILSIVSWHVLRDRNLTVETYLTRYLDNLTWQQTLQNEFDQGVKDYVKTTSVADGEVQLEGGCAQNPDGPKIYDDQFHNTWVIHPSGKNDIREIDSSQGEVYDGAKSLELINFNGADTKLRNADSICTLGFTRFEFYVYNSASVEQSFGIHGEWGGSFVEITIPPQSWEPVSLTYADVSGGNEVNLNFLFFKPINVDPGTIFYLDNLTLAGGVGGFYPEGTLISSIFDAGRETAFNQISFNSLTPAQTELGFQIAASTDPTGPWLFFGPGGTSDTNDLYTDPAGEGIWLGNNFGRYLRYQAFLRSFNGTDTPILYDITINYSP